MFLAEIEKTINDYTQWQHTSTERTPEAYVQYLARESALERLEEAIRILDSVDAALTLLLDTTTNLEDYPAEVSVVLNDLVTIRGNMGI